MSSGASGIACGSGVPAFGHAVSSVDARGRGAVRRASLDRPVAARGSFGQAELVESVAQRRRADLELGGEFDDVLLPLAPEALDDAFGHQQAGGEVVGDSLGLLVGGLEGPVVVEVALGRVVEHVLELVHQAEPLPAGGLVGVEGDQPVAAVPVGRAGDGQPAHG